MTAKRRPPRLGDLYVIRTPDDKPLVFTNGSDSISVHVVKLNGPDAEAVEVRSQAARARRWATVNDPESDEFLSHQANADQMNAEQMIELIVGQEMQKAAFEIPIRIAASEKWSTDDRLRSLQEAWYGDEHNLGLMFAYVGGDDAVEEEEDEVRKGEMVVELAEARRVWDQLAEYEREIEEALDDRRVELTELHEDEDDPDSEEYLAGLKAKLLVVMKRLDADLMYLEEQRWQKIFYCTRQFEDWRVRYFGTMDEVRALPEEVYTRIMDVYNELSLSGPEGKESPGTPGSSTSSVTSDEVGPSQPSGLATAEA
jgi:hypothetical protein